MPTLPSLGAQALNGKRSTDVDVWALGQEKTTPTNPPKIHLVGKTPKHTF